LFGCSSRERNQPTLLKYQAGGGGRTDTNIDVTGLFPKCDNSGSIKPQKEFPAAVSPAVIPATNDKKKSPSSFGQSDGPIIELWCEGSALTFGKQASAASPTGAGHERRRMRCDRARPFRQSESKFKPGTELRNGERAPVLPKDDLEKRAEAEMKKWLRTLRPRDWARFK
jgi:hypothetical protein